MSFICPQDVKTQVGSCSILEKAHFVNASPLCGIYWQKFIARLQFVWVQLEDLTKNIAVTDDGGKPNCLADSRALLVPEAASGAIAAGCTRFFQ
ncbi:hypothetical protein TNCV_5061321, partial [Trichonephila clavipes]